MAYLTLADRGRMTGPDGKLADMAEILSQSNEMIDDAPTVQANGFTSHITSMRTALPKGTYVRHYQGAAYTASRAAQIEYGMSILRDYSQVDKKLAELGGEAEALRMREDMGHMEGLSQQQSVTICYGNSYITPEAFTGFMPYYSTVNPATGTNAVNVFDCGGTGSSNASILLVGWGERTAYLTYPKGSKAGLNFEDKGDVVPGFDANNLRFEAYTSLFEWTMGLAIEDWRYIVRLANIDTTTAGLLGPTPPDIFAILARAVLRLPTAARNVSGVTKMGSSAQSTMNRTPSVKLIMYCDRTVRAAMDVQAIRDKNVLITPTEYDGQPVMAFRGIPIKVQDSMLNTEARAV